MPSQWHKRSPLLLNEFGKHGRPQHIGRQQALAEDEVVEVARLELRAEPLLHLLPGRNQPRVAVEVRRRLPGCSERVTIHFLPRHSF